VLLKCLSSIIRETGEFGRIGGIMASWDFIRKEEPNEEGQFDVRNVPNTPVLNIRLLHYQPEESSLGRVIDTVIEPDEEGLRIRVVRGGSSFPQEVRLWIRGTAS